MLAAPERHAPMNDYINFNRHDIGQTSLDEALSCLRKVDQRKHLWKYATIAIHNALQCYLSIALRGGSGIDTWKTSHAKKWLKAHEANEELPEVQLDYFMELYNKVFIIKPEEQRILINFLNNVRNEFIHFNTDSFSVHEPSLLSAFEQAVKDIGLTPDNSRGIFFYDCMQQNRFETTCESLSFQITRIKSI